MIFPHNILTLWGTEQFDLVCGIWVKRVNKTLRHGAPSPHVWLNDHFPGRFTTRQISFHDHFSLFLFLAWLGLFKTEKGKRERARREFLSLLKVLCADGWVSVRYRKGPDHHWMTLLRVTKPNWSRPPAANGPERNSPGWVMTVFSAFLFTPFWCPRTPHLTPAATSPVSSQCPCSQPSVPLASPCHRH